MQEDLQLQKKRFVEAVQRSEKQCRFVFTEFLTPAEQDVLLSMKLGATVLLEGGYSAAERRMARFGRAEEVDWEEKFPFVCLCIKPLSVKFSDELTHRDFLGALMSLGIKREVIGDIVLAGESAYLFCHESMADYICENLVSVRHTSVSCHAVDELPVLAAPEPERAVMTVASERADAVVAAVFSLSRSDSQMLFTQKKVFINSRVTESCTKLLAQGDSVSVRGYGKFVFLSTEGETRRGRLRIAVGVYK